MFIGGGSLEQQRLTSDELREIYSVYQRRKDSNKENECLWSLNNSATFVLEKNVGSLCAILKSCFQRDKMKNFMEPQERRKKLKNEIKLQEAWRRPEAKLFRVSENFEHSEEEAQNKSAANSKCECSGSTNISQNFSYSLKQPFNYDFHFNIRVSLPKHSKPITSKWHYKSSYITSLELRSPNFKLIRHRAEMGNISSVLSCKSNTTNDN